ncbi:transglutaminase-like cysteine peptidase [Photobacterium sp. ZSDE20]|uniref:Transglutaminase-like cysteine peptidase n=1 Tax=Photobacterium pectinilyticum TaxID=2906793 RepID=A0ABT1N499_9GAMM|nr:transglutaminase-like cysteine peptidase [Photobacterium sp. ZSDE20]MCQ1058694.1 transglutaminase-like cysteine peptidase [Photobacterium sp. ZSDE20]MDD1823408.1 transglutaminase-like cysteine peptidase [Photobacterium sp. ZSDE20]
MLLISLLLSTGWFNPSDVAAEQYHIGSDPLSAEEKEIVKRIERTYSKQAAMRVTAWWQLLKNLKQQDELTQLKQVNDFLNQMQFLDDIEIWGKDDYWATPLEFLGAGAGDCEEFSIAKYMSLRELGVNDEKLRLIYVKALTLNQFHMVLAYYPTSNAVPLLLDNLSPDILQASQRPDLQPIYSFNGNKLWLMKQRGQGQLVGDTSRIKHWQSLQQRVLHHQFAKPVLRLDGE